MEEDVSIDGVAGVVAEDVGTEGTLVTSGLESDVGDESDILSVLIVTDLIVGSGLIALGDALVLDAPVGVAGLGIHLPPRGRGGGEKKGATNVQSSHKTSISLSHAAIFGWLFSRSLRAYSHVTATYGRMMVN